MSTSSGLTGSGCTPGSKVAASRRRPLNGSKRHGRSQGAGHRCRSICCMQNAIHKGEESGGIPSKGDRIQLLRTRMGVRLSGTVYYSDQLQILVKWDNGSRRACGSASTATGFSNSALPLQERRPAADTVEDDGVGMDRSGLAGFAGVVDRASASLSQGSSVRSAPAQLDARGRSWTSAPLTREMERSAEVTRSTLRHMHTIDVIRVRLRANSNAMFGRGAQRRALG